MQWKSVEDTRVKMSDWFTIIVGDYILAPLITSGMLEAINKVNYKFGVLIGLIVGIGDTIIYIKKGFNMVTKIRDSLN